MVAHIVLFTPRSDLSERERAELVQALEHALLNIPLIKRARIGRRLRVGRRYDQLNPHNCPYAAILEFETEADLRNYLDHPAHQALGEQFYLTSEEALVFDFSLADSEGMRELLFA